MPSSAARIGSHASRRAQYTLSIGKGFQRLGFVDHADGLKINNSSSPSPARLSDDRPIRRSPSSEHSTRDGPVRPIQPGRRQCNLHRPMALPVSPSSSSQRHRTAPTPARRPRSRPRQDRPGPVRRVSVHAYSADTDGPVAHVTHTHGARVQLARRPRSRPGRRWAVLGSSVLSARRSRRAALVASYRDGGAASVPPGLHTRLCRPCRASELARWPRPPTSTSLGGRTKAEHEVPTSVAASPRHAVRLGNGLPMLMSTGGWPCPMTSARKLPGGGHTRRR